LLLRDNVYDAVRADILACRLAPGEELREQDLAERYEVSRAPVRDALLRLESERLVTIHPRKGSSVTSISLTDARDLFQFRLFLEPACASAAAENAPSDILQDLDRFRLLPEGDDFIEYNRAFHTALAEASGNRRMAAATMDLIDQAERLVRMSLASIKGLDHARMVEEHAAVIDALQRRDGRTAARLLRDHIVKAERRVLAALTRSAVIS
jgi:DNA-binding GntR family transcriptional regulator